jgi:group I intron endonuclease
MPLAVYWIHHKDHTDMFSQGYIGVSSNVKKRWYDHNHKPSNAHLQNAINKYGWDSLVKEVLLVANKAYCLMVESQLRSTNQVGWNVVKGGGMPPIFTKTGWKHTEEAKEKNRQAHLGKTLTKEQRQKVSEGLKKVSCATRFKKGHISWMVGKKLLPHVIEAVRQSRLGKKNTPEHRAKISLGLTGRVLSQETKDKIRMSNINCKIDCPHCNKVGNKGAMTRWHMDNCKFKGSI